jgi:hypothetical protein
MAARGGTGHDAALGGGSARLSPTRRRASVVGLARRVRRRGRERQDMA